MRPGDKFDLGGEMVMLLEKRPEGLIVVPLSVLAERRRALEDDVDDVQGYRRLGYRWILEREGLELKESLGMVDRVKGLLGR